MILYTHYEEAQLQLDGKDLFVVRALSAIHRSMLENANSVLKPAYPFNMQYYYDSLIRSLAGEYSHRVELVTRYDTNVQAVNIPEFSKAQWKTSRFAETGKARRFIELVQRESKQDGEPFDLRFACEIAAVALDEATLAFVEDGIGRRRDSSEDQFDVWLKGFNTPSEQQ